MNEATNKAGGVAELARRFYETSLGSRRTREALRGVETYCTFVGYPRSGHSIVGSMLDAHPEVIVAHELDALKFLEDGAGRDKILRLLVYKSNLFKRRGAVSSGYTYRVPNQWQGEFERLRVVGDKKGAGTIKRLQERPELLDRLRETMGLPLKFVHVLRNPYDNITTIYLRKQLKGEAPMSLDACADYYFSLCETVDEVARRVGPDMLDVRLEDFIADPKGALTAACRFLGVEPSADYLADCASIVYESPNKSRAKGDWTPERVDRVARRMAPFRFLDGYTFES